MIGKKEYINLARKNLICFDDVKAKIGRPMKVSKECIVGLVTALKIFGYRPNCCLGRMEKKKQLHHDAIRSN